MVNHSSKGSHASLSDFNISVASEIAIWRQAEWGDMRVGYETYLSDFDDTELLKGLPDDRCQCPHWGYLLTRRASDQARCIVRAGGLREIEAGGPRLVRKFRLVVHATPSAF